MLHGEVCLEPVAEEKGRSASVMRCFVCGLLSHCAGLLRGIENVRVVFVGSYVARGHLVVLVLCCLRAAPQREFFEISGFVLFRKIPLQWVSISD